MIFFFLIFCLISRTAIDAAVMPIDQMQAMRSIHSLQARDEQVRAFRRDFNTEIQTKKRMIGTTYDAVATLGLLADAINSMSILDDAKLSNLKGAALGTRKLGSFYDYGTREYLQSIFKAITMGVGYDQGVIKPATPLSKAEMDAYKAIVRSVNPYFDAGSQKPEPIHLKLTGMNATEIQMHIDEAHNLMCNGTTAKNNPTVFSSTDGENEIRFYDNDKHGYEFANYYNASITVPMRIIHPTTKRVWDFSTTAFPTSENIFQAVKAFILSGAYHDYTKNSPRDAFNASRAVTKIDGMQDYWDTIKNYIMLEAVKAKFSQNAELAALLLSTDENTLVENALKYDGYWGRDGGQNFAGASVGDPSRGGNWLGKVLVQVRNMLKTGGLQVRGLGTAVISRATILALPAAKRTEIEIYVKGFSPGFVLTTGAAATAAAGATDKKAVERLFNGLAANSWICGDFDYGAYPKGSMRIYSTTPDTIKLQTIKTYLQARGVPFGEGNERNGGYPHIRINVTDISALNGLLTLQPQTPNPWVLNVSAHQKTHEQITAQASQRAFAPLTVGASSATTATTTSATTSSLTAGVASSGAQVIPPLPMFPPTFPTATTIAAPAPDWINIQQAVQGHFIYSDGKDIYIMPTLANMRSLVSYLSANNVRFNNYGTYVNIPFPPPATPRQLALFAAVQNSAMDAVVRTEAAMYYDSEGNLYITFGAKYDSLRAILNKVCPLDLSLTGGQIKVTQQGQNALRKTALLHY